MIVRQNYIIPWSTSNSNFAHENLIEILDDINDLTDQINELRYRNSMDVQELLDQPEENKVVEMPTNKNIIEMVKNNERKWRR